MDERTLQYAQLINEMEQMPGYYVILENHRLTNSIAIFDQNYNELIRLLDFMESNQHAEEFRTKDGHTKLKAIDIELLRRLHNFVAGAKSFIDHTRRIYNKYYKEGNLFPEYGDVIQEQFANDPQSQFIQELREYCQHFRSPALIYLTRYSNGSEDNTREVVLDLKDLLSFDGWNPLSREYLQSKDENIPITKPIKEYREKVLRFYTWFQKRQLEIHKQEIDEFKAKEKELFEIQVEMQLSIACVQPAEFLGDPDRIFRRVLPENDVQKLLEKPSNDIEKPELVIQLLTPYISLSEKVKEDIHLVYRLFREKDK